MFPKRSSIIAFLKIFEFKRSNIKRFIFFQVAFVGHDFDPFNLARPKVITFTER